LYQNKGTLKLILKDENADEFVRNINVQVIDDSIAKTLYYKNKMLQGINDLMNKSIKDKKDQTVHLKEIRDGKESIWMHENVATYFKDDYKFNSNKKDGENKGTKVKMKFVNKEIKMKNNIHFFNEMKYRLDQSTDAKLLRYKKDAYNN